MIPAEKIKWIIENIKPEGFELMEYEGELNWSLNGIRLGRVNSLNGKMVYYPLFLQRVIEDINKKYDTWEKDNFFEIRYNNDNYYILDGANDDIVYFYFEDFENIDEAKEKAILYIVDKIRGEG